jgi:ribosomal protein L7Ae-like RNA K-turn-binding protein
VPVRHRGKERVPVDLEPNLMEHVQLISSKYNVPRTKLIRIFIKYGMNHVEEAIKQGDSLVWKVPQTSDN